MPHQGWPTWFTKAQRSLTDVLGGLIHEYQLVA
jgi:hypothetical protein